jgi:hypothetical protein
MKTLHASHRLLTLASLLIYLGHATAFAQSRSNDALNLVLTNSTAPVREATAWQVLQLYKTGARSNIVELFDWSDRFRTNGLREPAANALARIIDRGNGGERESAFWLWLQVQAERDALTVPNLDQLPKQASEIKLFHAWRAKLGNLPKVTFTQSSDAVISDGAKQVTAASLLSLSRRERGSGDVELAATLGEEALAIAPPDSIQIRNKEQPFIRLDIMAELASLYQAYTNLDKNGDKFERIERMLFEGKNTEYRNQAINAPLLEKYHTTLGLIYSERGQWEGGGARNATFQIERALEFAERNAATTGLKIKPVPRLREIYGEHLVTTHKNSSKGEQLLMDAAETYIDIQDLGRADKTLDAVQKSAKARKAPLPQRCVELKDVVQTWKVIDKSATGAPSADLRKVQNKSWLKAGAATALDPDFADRQRKLAGENLTRINTPERRPPQQTSPQFPPTLSAAPSSRPSRTTAIQHNAVSQITINPDTLRQVQNAQTRNAVRN